MQESWYCLIFGAELGPMSWDDLAKALARGELRPRDLVRHGSDGPWGPASAIGDLLAAAAELRPVTTHATAEGLGAANIPHHATDGPMAPDDTAFEVDAAIQVGPPADDVDFELTASTPATPSRPATPPSDTDFEITVAPEVAAVDDTDFEIASPASAMPKWPDLPPSRGEASDSTG